VTSPAKVVSPSEARRLVRSSQSAGEVVVLCHGCFDIVHPGHVRHLREARRSGDRLLVSITGDRSIDKGDGRPLFSQELRAENLAALDLVDWVTIDHRPTAAELLEQVRPDVYVKGREYEQNIDERFQAERAVVESYGGRVVFSSGDVVFSSTALVSALEDSAGSFQGKLRDLVRQHDLKRDEVERVVDSFEGRRVVVTGETILDTYVLCDRPDVAGESPVMTLRPLEYRHYDGGVAIVARHLAAMGARPVVVTALPDSSDGEALRERLLGEGIEVHAVPTDRRLPEKQRFTVGSTKMMKLDLGDPLTLDAARRQQLIDLVAGAAAGADALIVADYGLGLFTTGGLRELCRAVRPVVDLIVGDVSGRRSSLLAMERLDLLCPSEVELRDALHNYDDGLTSVVWSLLEQTGSNAALTTLGEDGLIAFDCRQDARQDTDDWRQRLRAVHVPSFAPYAVDQLGCGDTLLAAATLTLRLWDARLTAEARSKPHVLIETDPDAHVRPAHA
jgi:rfaE bifunctional protein nucleotidyltransferase chain/domain